MGKWTFTFSALSRLAHSEPVMIRPFPRYGLRHAFLPVQSRNGPDETLGVRMLRIVEQLFARGHAP